VCNAEEKKQSGKKERREEQSALGSSKPAPRVRLTVLS